MKKITVVEYENGFAVLEALSKGNPDLVLRRIRADGRLAGLPGDTKP